jgi:uncharacterized protein YajQ (UPF0234 family)
MEVLMPSFDIVSKVDSPSVDNGVSGVVREISTRYDFKGSMCKLEKNGEEIIMHADDELKRKQMEELLVVHLTRKNVDTNCLEFQSPENSSGNSIRQKVIVKQGIDREIAQKIIKTIKNSKIKVQSSIQGDEVRISGKKRDDLQQIIQLVKNMDLKFPLQYINFRD